MICVAIQEKDVNRCIKLLENIEMAEIRIDLACFDADAVKQIFSSTKKPLIATCRPNPLTDLQRIDLLKVAIANGAAMVDVEIESTKVFKDEIVAFARKHRTQVIVSYHNFESTPSKVMLDEIVKECYASGADIAKIATMVNSIQDNARLLSLYDSNNKLVILGMGQLGKITRITATLLGSVFTFAAIDEDSATAPGQVSFKKLENLIDSIKNS